LTRAQIAIAIVLLRSVYGAGYVPPPATGVVFSDVPADAFAAAWIEQLAFMGITEGCASDLRMYCPDQPIIRDDMAVFLLRAPRRRVRAAARDRNGLPGRPGNAPAGGLDRGALGRRDHGGMWVGEPLPRLVGHAWPDRGVPHPDLRSVVTATG
jgi:hypothetical protein